MSILIDNGHSYDTPWKHSPDVLLYKYGYTRCLVRNWYWFFGERGSAPDASSSQLQPS